MDAIGINKKRNPIFAGLLSVILPGLGHVYAGNMVKGLLLIALPYLVVIIVGLFLDFSVLTYFYGLFLFIVGVYLYALISSIMLARINKKYQLKKFNRWFIYIFIYMVAAPVATGLSSYKDLVGFKTYRIPSKSMHPTLQVGDYITVNTRTKKIDVGDVVVFPYPKDPPIAYIFRVVAIGGDSVSVDKGIVKRNGVVEDYRFPIEDSTVFARQKEFAETVIPDGELLVLGDNRARSNDSRYWGNVKASNVIGKARFIWYADNKSRVGTEIQ